MAVLPDEASFEEFTHYVIQRRGQVPYTELQELYERRLRLKSITISTGQGFQSILPRDEQGLTKRERENKVVSEYQQSGRNIEKLPEKAQF
ncbi:MAG: hypothetical protein CBD49_01055 [Acidimicrobiaceae bacterium TMED189]|nr:MAG: hypothetical protein CBD49_01055 [Acidimicrobiaceae bacterium TMED189]|tara:strand:- start:2909 stop:3181 length:273 start_codon:yes stop_codon:yes gene_type:complete